MLYPLKSSPAKLTRFFRDALSILAASGHSLYRIMRVSVNVRPCLQYLKKIVRSSARRVVFQAAPKKNAYNNHIEKGFFPGKPHRLIVMINSSCNLRCSFCDIPDRPYKKKQMSLEEADHVLSQAAALGVEECLITGGEPFLHPQIFDILDRAHRLGLRSIVTTNGTLLSRLLEDIARSPVFGLSVSVDGLKETHLALRNTDMDYDAMIEAMAELRRRGKLIYGNFVITNRNVNELPGLYRKLQEKNIYLAFFPVINKPGMYLRAGREKTAFLSFIRGLKEKGELSASRYEYYINMFDYFSGKSRRVRCLAFFREVGVDVNGNINPCCVWSNPDRPSRPLGNIFQGNDLKQVFYSEKAREARKTIYDTGCAGCFNPSISEFREMTGLPFMWTASRRGQPPLSPPASSGSAEEGPVVVKPAHVHMRFTLRCNLSCRHCDIWKTKPPQELPEQAWKDIISSVHRWIGPHRLDLAGGEILMRRDVPRIVRHAADLGLTVNLTTNGLLIDEPFAQEIAAAGFSSISFSLDGAGADTHNYIRNNPKAYETVMRNVRLFQKYRNRRTFCVNMSTVITSRNLAELKPLVLLTDTLFDTIMFQALDNNFHAPYSPDWYRTNEFWPSDAARVAAAIDGLVALKKQGYPVNNSFEQMERMKEYYRAPGSCLERVCDTGEKNLIIDESGGVRLCWNMAPVGNILENNIENIWTSDAAGKCRADIARCRRTCRVLNCNFAPKAPAVR